MAQSSIIPKSAGVQLRLVEVLESSADLARVRVALVDPAGALHFATIEFAPDLAEHGQFWTWRVVDDHCVQLPLAVLR